MGYRVKTIAPDDPPDAFPDPQQMDIALGYPDGLLAIGGDLSPERLLAAYSQGIFPWYNDDQPILWWSPDPRAVIYPEGFHMSRSLVRELRNPAWTFSLNQDFAAVIHGCANNRGEHGTWITAEMASAYMHLHELGYAHSVESWHEGELAGGIYGVRLGSIFFAESMFSARSAGSKVALSALVQLCKECGIEMLDCQMESDHLATLGMKTLPRKDFLQALGALVVVEAALKWCLPPRPAKGLAGLRKQSAC
jgi:leucyl/phenylalanyl-tRNA--protein transferase